MKPPKPYLRIIGDVHKEVDSYLRLANDAAHTLQIGDFGFRYDIMNTLDPLYHKFLPGNHDNYTSRFRSDLSVDDPCVLNPKNPFSVINNEVIEYEKLPEHFIGNYGCFNFPGGKSFFFVRGAFSIDQAMRTQGVNWWPEEELSHQECQNAIELYEKEFPDIVITHDAPFFLYKKLLGVKGPSYLSKTTSMLYTMYTHHQPKIWIFGHHHQSQRVYYKLYDQCEPQEDATLFIALNIAEHVDFDENFNILESEVII